MGQIVNLGPPSCESESEIKRRFLSAKRISGEVNFARRAIHELTGLTLTTIEAVGLRRIAVAVLGQLAEHKANRTSDEQLFMPYEEITNRFLFHFYGVCRHDIKGLVSGNGVKEWFRKEQEKMHLI